MKIYVDGVLDAQKTTPVTAIGNSAGVNPRIGYHVSGGEAFLGFIDEPIIENRAWTASEVAKYYTATAGRF